MNKDFSRQNCATVIASAWKEQMNDQVNASGQSGADLDKLMQNIRLEIDQKQTMADRKDVAACESGRAPSISTANKVEKRLLAAADVVAKQKHSRTNKKGLREKLDVRILFQRLLGIRRYVKLGRQIEGIQNGPIPASGLPDAVCRLEQRVALLASMGSETPALSNRVRKLEALIEGNALANVEKIVDDLLGAKLDAFVTKTKGLAEQVSTLEAALKTSDDDLALALAQVKGSIDNHWRYIADQNRRLDMLIEEARRRLPEPMDAGQINQFSKLADGRLSALYVEFEDRYRGSREDIAQRQSVYLNSVRKAAEATGQSAFVDIGCGRGEFLELLRANGFAGKGIDLNEVMVELCNKRGLDALTGDAIEYLRALPEGSLAGVSSFHMIEHIPFEALVVLLDESLRALAPGGMIILETPNPANLVVAAERFYFDPTHRNPLPSELVAFVAEARGFVNVKIQPLHPVSHQKREYDDPMLSLLQEKVYGPQDYGLIAWKPN